MIRLLLIFFTLCSVALSQERREYFVPDFLGGLNVVTDSVDLQPNEALLLDNFTLDRFGAGHKRFGIENWNDSLISGSHIQDIYFLDSRNSSNALYVVTDSFIFEADSWQQYDNEINWQTGQRELDYTRGQIDTAISGQKYIYGDTTSWILAGSINDRIIIGDSTYIIDSILADTLIHVTTTVGTHGGEPYRLLKFINGDVQLSSYQNKLFVADDESWPWFYKNDEPFVMGILDSGTVDSVIGLPPDTSGEIYYFTGDSLSVEYGSTGLWFIGDTLDTGIAETGDYLFFVATVYSPHQTWTFTWSSEITFHDRLDVGDASFIVLQNAFSHDGWSNGGLPYNYYFPETFTIPYSVMNLYLAAYTIPVEFIGNPNDSLAIYDSTKSWKANDFVGTFLMNGNDAKKYSTISANMDKYIYFDTTAILSAGDRYYVFTWLPATQSSKVFIGRYIPWGNVWHDSLFTNKTIWDQIIFHKNRLYAIGKEVMTDSTEFANAGDTIYTNRVWYSERGIPDIVYSDYNFDLAASRRDKRSLESSIVTTAMFELRDDLYVITRNGIFRMSGEPNDPTGNWFVTQPIAGVGTNQPNGVITTKDNIAYIMNQEGIWQFDGRIIEKISYKIEPLIERYRGSKMVAGQFKDNLYFSYPDSNVTIVMHLPTKAFTTWSVGMETMNNQFVAIDSNYFLFSQSEDSAYVLKYPRDNSTFTDVLEPSDTTAIVASYNSGWQTYGTLRNKTVEDIEITAFNSGVSVESGNHLIINSDFSTTAEWDSNGFAGGNRIHIFDNVGDSTGSLIWGNAFQIAVYDSTLFDFFLSNYKIRWYLGDK